MATARAHLIDPSVTRWCDTPSRQCANLWLPHGVQHPALAPSREVAEIFDWLGSSAETSQMRLHRQRTGRLLGRFFAASRERPSEVSAGLGLRRVPNLGGCP
jgi:hypothetical protein